MTFVQIETRNGMVNLDGYSRNKTLNGALKDLAREVAKIDKTEADGILNNIDEMAGMATDMMNISNEWYIEAQEVHCASRRSEKNDEMEYAEGHWYLYIRFCAPEQENDEPETSSTDGTAHETETNDMVMKCEMKQCDGHAQTGMPGRMKTMKTMKREKCTAPTYITNASTEKLLELWELTASRKPSVELAIVRGWLMDELEIRDRKGFNAWLEDNALDADLRKYMMF